VVSADAFERDLRAALEGMASATVSRSLSEGIAALPSTHRRTRGWVGRLGSVAVGALAIVLFVVLGGVVVSRAGWSASNSGAGAAPKAFTWGTQLATLAADRLTIEAGGKTFVAPQELDYVTSDPGDASYRTLELGWHDEGTEMRLNIYFAADSTSWGIQHIRTYDGREPGEWIYYLGPLAGTPLGARYDGNVDLLGLGTHGVGRLRIDGMTLRAFEPGTIPPAFDDCRAVGRGRAYPFGPAVGHEPHPDLSEFGIAEGMEASDVHSTLAAQGICHEFRLEFPAINRGQIWCTPPPGNVREFAFGSSGEILVFVEDRTRLPVDTELPQIVGC
jgi:hypothetical protein